jgi:RNA polymerase sigma-70 factor (ECF subfamily)
MQNMNGLQVVLGPYPPAPIRGTSDQALIEAIANKDRHALELLFARHSVRLYRFILRFTSNPSLTEDVVSEVFLEVWRRPEAFRAKSQVSTWLFAIARNKALQALRPRSEEQLEDGAAAALVDTADDPETAFHHKNRSAIIRKCLLQLPAPQREIVDLVYYHEKSVSEVAQIVGIPTGTVKTRMFHARNRMAELLAQAGVDGFLAC